MSVNQNEVSSSADELCASSHARPPLGDRPLFTAGSRTYSMADAIAAAVVREDWQRLEEQVRGGLACVRLARENGGLPVVDLDAAALEFRYARDLITSEEIEAWLARAGVTIDQWLGFLERNARREAYRARLPQIRSRVMVTDQEVEPHLWVEAVCSGQLRQFATTLASHATVAARSATDPSDLVVPDDSERLRLQCEALFRKLDAHVPAAAPSLAHIRHLAALNEIFDHVLRQAVTTDALDLQVERHRIDWVIVRCRSIAFADAEQAREAVLCLSSDRMPLEEVAATAGVAITTSRQLLEGFAMDQRVEILSAHPGEIVGPCSSEKGFAVLVVDEKVPPHCHEPLVRQRAEESIVATIVADSLKHVVWHDEVL